MEKDQKKIDAEFKEEVANEIAEQLAELFVTQIQFRLDSGDSEDSQEKSSTKEKPG